MCEPLEKSEEAVVTAEVDLSMIGFAKQMLDIVGHYSRPDLLSLPVNPEAAKKVTMK
ncbi:hypothetical protein MMC30_006256 [Trapelia coarctata]|nr:hypothetical protein [Trapelia coarctata]